MATHRNQQHQQRMYDVVCEKCDDIGELLNLSVLTGLQGNNHFEGHLIYLSTETPDIFEFKDG